MNGFISRFNKYLSHDGRAVTKNWFDPGVYKFVVNKIFDENPCDPFFVFNIQDVIDKHNNWQQKLPRVRPFYSVKANNNQVLLEVLAQLNVGFECVSEASKTQQIIFNNSTNNFY